MNDGILDFIEKSHKGIGTIDYIYTLNGILLRYEIDTNSLQYDEKDQIPESAYEL